MGALVYELFTGLPPFDHSSRTVTCRRILTAEPDLNVKLTPVTADFIRKALVKVCCFAMLCSVLQRWQRLSSRALLDGAAARTASNIDSTSLCFSGEQLFCAPNMHSVLSCLSLHTKPPGLLIA